MRLIAGIYENEKPSKVRYWTVGEYDEFCLGDYAIVESGDSFTLVRIIADVHTSEGFDLVLSQYNLLKRVVKIESVVELKRKVEDLDFE